MRIGYACLTLGVPGTDLRRCRIENADEERLCALISHNLDALQNMLAYNRQNGIGLFRLSSDIIPFASSPKNTLAWDRLFEEKLSAIARFVRESGMRLSMHPGQYTVLNAPDESCAARAAADLRYHVRLLDSLGLDARHKVILHLGGVYGDKKTAKARFCRRFGELPDAVRQRIVIENDDRAYHIGDVLEIGTKLSIPVVYDNLHNAVNGCDRTITDAGWIAECAKTWREKDGAPKVHYSQQDRLKRAGSHSEHIEIDPFLAFYHGLGDQKPDIMLEVKDKNISAVKCRLCTAEGETFPAVSREWNRYEYLVLERSPRTYCEIRSMLTSRGAPAPAKFYRLIENAMREKITAENGYSAARHVWDRLEAIADEREKAGFMKLLDGFCSGRVSLVSVKQKLLRLAAAYGREDLMASYYFIAQLYAGYG
ncbi:MAG: UV DNA damage repair endonuclease UvsE [Oscillospiraceae bacterium]